MKFKAKDLIKDFKKYNEMRIELVGESNVNKWGMTITPQIFIKDFEIYNSSFDF